MGSVVSTGRMTFTVVLPFLFLLPGLDMSLLKYSELWYYRSHYGEKSIKRSAS
jgi:hypothetical protein